MNPTINFFFDEYSHYLLFFNGFLSILVNIFAVHVILKRSSRHMSTYKWLLLHVTMSCALGDLFFSVIFAPVPLENGVGTKMRGIFGALFPSQGRLFCVILDVALFYTIWANLLCFAYRLYLLTTTKYQWIHKYLLLLVSTLFVVVIGSVFIYLPALAPEEEIRSFARTELGLVQDDLALWLILPANFEANTRWALYCLGFVVITYISFAVITIIANNILKKIGNMTRGSVAHHKMLLRSLIMQTIVPLITVLFPLLLTGYAQKLKQRKETAPYARMCSIPGLLMLSNYSLSHVAVMFFYTTPYQKYISKLIRQYSCGKVKKYEDSHTRAGTLTREQLQT